MKQETNIYTPPSQQKAAQEENVPVASLLLPKKQRAVFLSFYTFLRLADDIADDPAQSVAQKTTSLSLLKQALLTEEDVSDWRSPAMQLRQKLQSINATNTEALHVLDALEQDARGIWFTQWSELEDYCDKSANPVGHFLLKIFKQPSTCLAPANALCRLLAILNFWQDLKHDFLKLNRLYIPETCFKKSNLSPRDIPDLPNERFHLIQKEVLDYCKPLLHSAAMLPHRITHPRLRFQAAITFAMAKALYRRCQTDNPLEKRISLRFIDKIYGVLHGTAIFINATYIKTYQND